MKHLLFIVTIGSFLFVSCGDDTVKDAEYKAYETVVPPVNELREGIKTLEDSLLRMSQDLGNVRKQLPNLTRHALIEKLLLLYRNYPKDKDAAACLDKVYSTYSSLNAHDLSLKFADTLLTNYPKYDNRPALLRNLATDYDVFIKPRDKEKVKYYYNLLLKENPNLPQEARDEIKFRLDHIDLTFEELIVMQAEAI
ncbi:MAG: hypothetical protein ACI837_003521 [Crocinitomicaceae bacterium]|jgi:hypothetical protein